MKLLEDCIVNRGKVIDGDILKVDMFLNHLVDALSLIASVRNQAVFDILADQVTQGAAEVLVTRVREERTAVGEHADEAREQTEQ